MVGKLGCGCCGPRTDDPIWYGPCDCGQETEAVRGDYEYGWDEPVPNWKPFQRPAGGGVPYTDWIHSSRFHAAPRSTFTTTFQPPYFTGFNNTNLFPNNLPHGIGIEGASSPSHWATQFCWNEFNYEISTDVRVNSGIQPVLIRGQAGVPLGAEYTRVYAVGQQFTGIYLRDPNLPFAPDFQIVATCRTFNFGQNPSNTWSHRLELRNQLNDNYLLPNGFTQPPLRVLNFDQTYNIKLRMSSPAVSHPNSTTITFLWTIDGSPFATYELGTNLSVYVNWSNCTPNTSPAVWRLLTCTLWSYRAAIAKYAWYNANPALQFYWDNFLFNAIRK